MTDRVLILTASMGAGHDRVASELGRRLRTYGLEAELLDVWDLLPMGTGALITGFYKVVIRRVPWLYEGIYRVWLEPGGERSRRVSPLVALARRRLLACIGDHPPAVAVSTFHLCSQLLGELRRRGLADFPTATVVVDFAAHGLWVDPEVDVHVCLHETQAERVRARGAPLAVPTGPIVEPRYAAPRWSREDARAALALEPDARVVLVVAGSWGAGPVERTVASLAARADLTVVAVAGRNRRLQERLERIGGARVFGWVDDLDRFMAAADVVVENAGGLTAMEAMAMGVPVVSCHPIPGHGRVNVSRMAEAGISVFAADDAALHAAVDDLTGQHPARRRLIDRARAMFSRDPAGVVAGLVESSRRAAA